MFWVFFSLCLLTHGLFSLLDVKWKFSAKKSMLNGRCSVYQLWFCISVKLQAISIITVYSLFAWRLCSIGWKNKKLWVGLQEYLLIGCFRYNQYGERIQQGFLIPKFRSTICSFYPNSAAYSSEIKPNEDKLFLGPCISSISQRHWHWHETSSTFRRECKTHSKSKAKMRK